VKLHKSNFVPLIVSAVLIVPVISIDANGQAKNSTHRRDGQASIHMSPKGSANSNAQWSADPTRGWIRAEERHELRKANLPSKKTSARGKPKAKRNAQGH